MVAVIKLKEPQEILAHELEKMHDALFFGMGTYKALEARDRKSVV
jgi:hypothetical protein